MRIKKRIILPLAITAIFCIVLFVAVQSQMKGADDSDPIAMVDGATITRKVLEREVRKAQDSYAMQGIFPDEDRLAELRQEVLERLIETELLWRQSVREGIVVNEKAVSDQLEEIKKQYINENIFNNVMEISKMTLPELLLSIRKDLAIRALVDRDIAASLSISQDEGEQYYRHNTNHFEEPEKIRASRLFISLKTDASDADKQKAEASIKSLEDRLNAGESFEALARDASDCASSENGGDLGFIVRGTMDEKFEEAAFSMQLHEVSPIVKSSSGYHIIKVTDRQKARLIPFNEVKEKIEQHLLDQKIHKAVKEYLVGLRNKADIKLSP